MPDENPVVPSTSNQPINPMPPTDLTSSYDNPVEQPSANLPPPEALPTESNEQPEQMYTNNQEQQFVNDDLATDPYFADDYDPDYASHPIKTLLSWKGNGRPFRNHGKEYYINASLIVLIFEVLLFLFSQYVLMLVIISMLFVVFALAVVPPHTVNYRISTEGIAIDDYFYLWQELYDFYFKHINGEDILHIRTKDEYASDITVLLGDIPKEYIKSLLINYLPYREVVPLSFMEKSGNWLTRTFPLDKVPSTTK